MNTQFGKRSLESAICVLCGERKATTKEHIPPNALFITKPREYFSVPACEECNHSTKLEDEYLLHAMSGGSLYGEGVEVWKKKVRTKLHSRPKTRLGLRNQLSIRNIEINPKESMVFPVLQLNKDRIEKSIRKMVQGLFWWHTETMLTEPSEWMFEMINPADGKRFFNEPSNQEIFRQTEMGIYTEEEVKKTFFYTWAVSEELALFYFFFYKQNIFICAVRLPN